MRSKGSRFTLGVLGLSMCSLDVAQPSATIRNRPRDCCMAVPLVSSPEGSFLDVSHVALLRFAWQAWHSWHSDVFLRVRRNTLDASCCVFFANRIGRAESSGDKVQIPWQAWHFVRCAENWRKPRTKHRFRGSKFRGSHENSQETSILKLQSVKIGGSLARKARFDAPTSLVSTLWFPVASPCLWGKLQTFLFRRFPSRLSCRFAWQGWHFVTCPLCSLPFPSFPTPSAHHRSKQLAPHAVNQLNENPSIEDAFGKATQFNN